MNTHFKTAIFAGGCFWCTEAIFKKINGVVEVISGYTGGFVKNPAYREVCNGTTGHAEATKIIFDDNKVSYKKLLEIFFATHDPTTLNKQGNDIGTQYRSAIFYVNENQKIETEAFIDLLIKKQVFHDPIVTEVKKFKVFYNADQSHQDYYNRNTQQGYCQIKINPKLRKLEQNYKHSLK